jgi:hypothetical protein
MAKNTKFGDYTPPSRPTRKMDDAPTKKKDPIVTKEELDNSKMDLNTFMNAYEHDGKEWKLRDKPKMRQTMVDQIRRSNQQEKVGHSQPYGSSKKKKDPIVSEKEFKEFNKSGGKTLRDFMNAKQYDEATGKFVDRAKALTRREDKRSDAKASPVTYRAKTGGSVKSKSASSRGDGIAQRGKTRA